MGAGTTSIGRLEYSPGFVQTISTANDALTLIGREGAFVNDQKMEFELLHYINSIADWQTSLTTEAQYYVPPDETLIESIHSLLDRTAGEIILRELIEATRFRRSD